MGGMGSMVKVTVFSHFLRRSAGALRSSRDCADSKLGAWMMMMSTGVDSSPSSRIMPLWLMLPPVFEEDGDMVYKFYNLSEEKEESFLKKRSINSSKLEEDDEMPDDDAKFVGSSHGWLALFNQRNNHLFLSNPINRRHIKLPPIETLPDPRINLTRDGCACVSKLILSSSQDDECIAMMIFGQERRLAFCQPRRSTKWTPIGDLYYNTEGMFARTYFDFEYSSKQKLCFCQSRRDLECWDLSDPLSSRIHSSWKIGSMDLEGQCAHEEKSIRSTEWPEVKRHVNLVYAEQYNYLFLVMRYVMARMSPDGSYFSPSTLVSTGAGTIVSPTERLDWMLIKLILML